MISGASEKDLKIANEIAELSLENYKLRKEIDGSNNIINEIIDYLTPDYEEYKHYIDKRDDISDLYTMYWLGVAETSEYVLNKLKKLKEQNNIDNIYKAFGLKN